MKIIILLAALILSSFASAQPFLYGDTVGTSTATTTCGVYLDTQPKIVTTTVLVGSIVTCKYDLVSVSNGSHTVKLTTIVNDTTWGNQESAPSPPFVFVRPAPATAPANLKIGP